MALTSTSRTPASLPHDALEHDYDDAARVQAEKGADVNVKDQRGTAPLHAAAQERPCRAARLPVDRGADVNAKCLRDRTSLRFAAFSGLKVLARGCLWPWVQTSTPGRQAEASARTARRLAVPGSQSQTAVVEFLNGRQKPLQAREAWGARRRRVLLCTPLPGHSYRGAGRLCPASAPLWRPAKKRAAMAPLQLCHTEKMAPGTAAMG